MKKRTKIIVLFVLLVGAFFIYLFSVTQMDEPQHPELSEKEFALVQVNDSVVQCDDSWLKLNQFGIWELFVQGDPYTMGFKNGQLTEKLIQYQEKSFVEQIEKLVPSRSYLQFLRVFLGWFNRDLLANIPEEYQLEVAGISKSASDEYNFIAPPFQRIMSYHGAHDMGHALQSMCLVGCTSFGVWNNYSADSSLLIGRNFDFYAGDKFSENKIIAFVKPNEGHEFMSVTWGGMIGVVSGMNIEGLTITLNAEPSEIPFISKTPVSILARKILQYASTIDEAFEIAKEYETFVSESFLIGSGKENKVALIEKTTKAIVLHQPQKNYLTVTNHFLDSALVSRTENKEGIFEGASQYRQQRVESIINDISAFNIEQVVGLLRDRNGKHGENIGFGNEKAINQFIAHHGIVFKPQEKKVWISAAPFQLGNFVAYDLDEIFANPQSFSSKQTFDLDACIAADPILNTEDFKNFLQYKKELLLIQKGIENKTTFTKNELDSFIQLNKEFYYPWMIVGNYYFKKENYSQALEHFSKALVREIPEFSVYNELKDLEKECKKKLL